MDECKQTKFKQEEVQSVNIVSFAIAEISVTVAETRIEE